MFHVLPFLVTFTLHAATTDHTDRPTTLAGIDSPDPPGTPVARTISSIYVGPPDQQLGHVGGYAGFANRHGERIGMIAATATDGRLHILNAATGAELHAYLPSIPPAGPRHGSTLGQPATDLRFDGALASSAVQDGTGNWQTLLAGGGGHAYTGLFLLDVTDADAAHPEPVLELGGPLWGHVHGAPRFARVSRARDDPAWALISGNGQHDRPGHPTALMIVDPASGSVHSIPVPGVAGGLSTATLLSIDGDDIAELAIAGDRQGNLWSFDIEKSKGMQLYRGDSSRPILQAPAVARHPGLPGYIVTFGSSGNGPGSQFIAGIHFNPHDREPVPGLPLQADDLVSRPLETARTNATTTVRVSPETAGISYRCNDGERHCSPGWLVELPGCAEQVNGPPVIRAGRVLFGTRPGKTCTGGADTGWLLSLDLAQGNAADRPVFDINHDHEINDQDRVRYGGQTLPATGIRTGSGTAAPAVVPMKDGSDRVRLNPVVLPLLPVSDRNADAGLPQILPTAAAAPAAPAIIMPGPGIISRRIGWTDITE